MVYCGKPSGGCHACRERKTKCDKIPEGCTQCKRAKRVCPGYRVPGDLVFRDQSSNVIQKFKAKEAKAKQAASGSSNAMNFGEDGVIGLMHDESVELVDREDTKLAMFSLAPTLEERATGFFIANYVLGLSGPSKGHLDYLADMARREVLDDGLMCSIKAVGLAGYSHSAHAPSLMSNARYQYMKALQSTNRALRDPEAAKKDSTLISIMILTIFETITGCRQSSLKDWAQHVHGSAALIKLRGEEQLKTIQGRKMMVQITASMMIYCLQAANHVPDHLYDYMNKSIKSIPKSESSMTVTYTMMLFCNLRADVRHGIEKDPHKILARAMELDNILKDIEYNNPPEGWEYETIFTDETCEYVWNGRYHVYYDYWIAQIWNALRVVRILAHEMIRTVFVRGFAAKPPVFNKPEHTIQFQESVDTLYALQADILYSVVQHVGYFPKPTEKFQHSSVASKKIFDLNEELADVRMSGGSFLLWPLYLVGNMDLSDAPVRNFAVRNLELIGDRMGIAQAHVLAKLVKTQKDFEEFREVGEQRVIQVDV